MKSLKNFKKASLVALSTLALVFSFVAAPTAFAKDNGGDKETKHNEARKDRGDRRHEENKKDRGDKNETAGDMDSDNN